MTTIEEDKCLFEWRREHCKDMATCSSCPIEDWCYYGERVSLLDMLIKK